MCVREEGADKKLHKKGTTVVPHTKTTSGNRILPLTPDAKKYINLILDFNMDNGLVNPDGYIFINNNGTRRNA
ncbi:MAG: hypothetical protein II035_04955, partial [Firmicutes bacterium]|nr:hypothetical protein [Bacillota bacterium]